MSLWIRSQDKRILQKIDNIFTNANYDDKRICTICDNDVVELGQYKSKERALEVLDEIQNKIKSFYLLKPEILVNTSTIEAAKNYYERLNNIDIITCGNNFTITPINQNIIVYEMPKE